MNISWNFLHLTDDVRYTDKCDENNKITLNSLKEDLQTVDIADIITQISQQQTALQASMYASSAMTKISMLDYI